MRALMWLTELPLEAYGLAGIIVCCFWTAVLMRRLDRRRLDLDEEWQRFIGRQG
jgi:hypothetical protein